MKDLNILILTPNWSGHVGAPLNRHQFKAALSKYANCAYAGKGYPDYVSGENIEETVRRVMPDADWVIDEEDMFHVPKPQNRRYRVGVFVSDIHAKYSYGVNNPASFAELINSANYDAVFLRYPYVYGTGQRPGVVKEMLGNKVCWVPWSVDTSRYYPRDKIKYDASFLGSTYDCYPLRKMIWDGIYYVGQGHRILRQKAPTAPTDEVTYRRFHNHYIVGQDYEEALGSSRILIFDCSKYLYPILKFFEAAASGSLILSNAPSMGKQLGFVPGETMVAIDVKNWDLVLKECLDYPDLGKSIARKALGVVQKYHTHDIRAQQLISFMEKEKPDD